MKVSVKNSTINVLNSNNDGDIERGEHNLTLINLQKIANALGTKPSVLLKAAGN